jgi:hypothetical protein
LMTMGLFATLNYLAKRPFEKLALPGQAMERDRLGGGLGGE